MTKRKQSIVEGGLILTLALIIIKLLGWLYRVQINSIYGETGAGYYMTAYNLYSIVYSITVMGFPVAISKIIAEYITQGRYKDIKKVIRISTVLFAVVGIVGSAILLGMAKPYADYLVREPLAFWGIIAVAPSIFFCCLMSVYRGYNQGLSDMKPTAVSQVIEVLVKVAAGLACAVAVKDALYAEYASARSVLGTIMETVQEANVKIAALSAAGAMFGITLSTAVGYLYLWLRYRRTGDTIRKAQINASPEPRSDKYILKHIIWMALPIALSAATASFAGLIDNSTIPNNIARLLVANQETVLASHNGMLANAVAEVGIGGLPMYLYGLYGMEIVIANLIPTITGSFGMSALPLVSASWAQNDLPDTKKNMDAAIRITMLISAPAGFGLAFLAQPISSFVYSNKPIGALLGAPMLQLLGVAYIFVALLGIVNSLLQGIGKPWTPLWLMVFGLVIKAVTNYIAVGIPQYNIKAAPLGNLLCYFFISIAGLIVLRAVTKLKVNILGSILKPVFAGFACGAFGLLAYNLISKYIDSNAIALFFAIGVAAIVYVMVLGIVKGLEKEDILAFPAGKKIAWMLEKLRILR